MPQHITVIVGTWYKNYKAEKKMREDFYSRNRFLKKQCNQQIPMLSKKSREHHPLLLQF